MANRSTFIQATLHCPRLPLRLALTCALLFLVRADLLDTSVNEGLNPIFMDGVDTYFETAFAKRKAEHDFEDMFSDRQTIQGPTFLSGPVESQVFVSMINGTADAQVSYVFVPEANFTIEDYTLSSVISNPNIAADEDVSISWIEDSRRGFLAYNVTVDFDFNKWTGQSDYRLDVLNKTTQAVEVFSADAALHCVGITFFSLEGTNSTTIFGGPSYPLAIPAAEIIANRDYNLGVFIHFVDGTSSNTSLSVQLSGISVSTSGVDDELSYDDSSCAADVGTYTGTDVQLPAACGIGFSTNTVDSTNAGPKFGMDFNKYRNGSFVVGFEWNDLVIGSDLEAEGYMTYLDVSVVGEVPPVVYSIAPSGPFSSLGTEKAALNVANLPSTAAEASLWTYALSIAFSDGAKAATFDDGSITIYPNGTASMTFTLPAGTGVDLPWTLTATKPTGEELAAVDQTDPKYLFTFSDQVFIDGITPTSGPETGGTDVTLIGEFPNANSSNVEIFFDGVLIDPSLIGSVSAGSITFTTPPKAADGGLSVVVTIQVAGVTSNGVNFTYEPTVRLDSMTPDSGPIEGGTAVTLAGQFIDFDPNTQNSGIYFGGTQIDSGLIQSYDSSKIVFNTPTRAAVDATESIYAFNVTVQVGSTASNTLTFTYDAPVIIDTITPSSGDEAGGTTVTLLGQFTNYDASTSSVVVGGKELDPSLILSVNGTALQFVTPPLAEVGLSYVQQVWVNIGVLTSNKVTFTYTESEPQIVIDGEGGTFDASSGNHQLGACSNAIFRVSVSSGSRVQNVTYLWTMTAVDSTVNILAGTDVTTNSDAILLPYTVFPQQNVRYVLTITISINSQSFSKTINVMQLSVQKISVSIIDPQPRSPSNPNVTLTIPSFIGLPGCTNTEEIIINSTAMSYEWVYLSKTYNFSYLNETAPEDEISPTLLGREFHIPQALMQYGSFRLSLTAYFTEDASVRGSDSTTVVIEPATLVAQINGGEVSQIISETQDFKLSAADSRDPDILTGDFAAGLQFAWTCRYAYDANLISPEPCDNTLMPPDEVAAVEFTIPAGNLAAVQNDTSRVYIEYSLQVSKTSQNATGSDISRVSAPVTSTLILPQEKAQSFESLEAIVVVNNQSATLDRTNVKYYEDVTITPVSKTTETTWSFEVLSPASQTRTLLASDSNLLTFPGFYTAGADAGRDSLGLKANVLSPNTEYQLLISTFRAGFSTNEQVISLTTVEQPTVTIGKLATPSGTTNDTYVLSAITSYDGDFKFFFILSDDFGFETCVGGCQGINFVRFRLATPGVYQVRCDVYDSLGFTLLATADSQNITVSSEVVEGGDLSIFSGEVNDAFLAGDHSDYQQLGIDMVKYILSNKGSVSTERDSEILANFTAGLNQVAGNAIPNAIQSAGYVRTAYALASLTPALGITYDTQTLYFLINITVNAVQRTPDTAALQQLQELVDFYDLAPELVQASQATGTTRRRLLQEIQLRAEIVAEIWLDLYETMRVQLGVVALKPCPCGCVKEIETGVSSRSREGLNMRLSSGRQGSQLTAAAAYTNPNQGLLSMVKLKYAHFCNPEQGTELVLDKGTDKEVKFAWCKEVYGGTIRELDFGLATAPNYIFLSGLYLNVTLTDGLVATMIAELDKNTFQDAMTSIPNCYTVSIPVLKRLTDFPEGAPEDQRPQGMFFAPQKEWGVSGSSGLYAPRFDNMTTAVLTESSTDYASAAVTSSTTGIFSVATQYAWRGALFSLEGVFMTALQVAGVTLLILVLILVASLAAWLLATRVFAVEAVAGPVEVDFTYVERDVYGRGTALDIMAEQEAIAGVRGG